MKNQIKLIFLFVFIVFISGIAFSQNRWEKVYHDEIDAPGEYIIESYDHGYLLLGRHEANYPKYMWLIKTDLNGEILWEKTIGDGMNPFVLIEMEQNINGCIYLCGQYNNIDPNGNPIIIKLDTCGEKLWCKEFHTQNNHDFASCIAVTPDRGAAVTLNFTGATSWIDRICLTRFKPDGEILWTKCYNSPDTSLRAEDDFDLIKAPDNGFLITGFCYYEDPTHPNLYWPEPYYIKVDSSGNFQWETVVHKEDPLIGGQAWSTVISPDSLYYYSSISHYYYDDNTSSPALLKMDMSGNVLGIYDLVIGYQEGKLFTSVFINDSLIACSAGWGNTDDDFVSDALIIDTLGNIINSRLLHNDIYLSYTVKTFDDKLLYFTNEHLQGHFDAYLFKLNFELEDDTLYTQPFTYDSLCPYPIVSDTIAQDDCELIVGMKEVKPEKEEESDGILIYPNPAQNIINIEYPIMNDECRNIISIYDIFGRKAKEIKVPKGQNEVIINVSKWNRGIYIAVLWQKGKLIAKEKFMIIR